MNTALPSDRAHHIAAKWIVRQLGGNPNRLKRDHAADDRFHGKAPMETAQKEIERQRKNN